MYWRPVRVGLLGVLVLLVVLAGSTAVVQVYHRVQQPTTQHASHRCLLPTYDAGYLQNPGVSAHVLCVNTGKRATPADIAAALYAPQCQDGGYVPCYHPCFAYTPNGPYPVHPVPCTRPSTLPFPYPLPSSSVSLQFLGASRLLV